MRRWLFTRAFWTETVERMVSTSAAAVAPTLVVGAGITAVNGWQALDLAAGAALASLLLSLTLGALPWGDRGAPSITRRDQ
jgi:hypothetical protein